MVFLVMTYHHATDVEAVMGGRFFATGMSSPKIPESRARRRQRRTGLSSSSADGKSLYEHRIVDLEDVPWISRGMPNKAASTAGVAML